MGTIFGGAFRAWRVARGLSQQQLADAVGLTQAAVSTWEQRGSMPRGDTLQRLADYYGVTVTALLAGPKNDSGVPSDAA